LLSDGTYLLSLVLVSDLLPLLLSPERDELLEVEGVYCQVLPEVLEEDLIDEGFSTADEVALTEDLTDEDVALSKEVLLEVVLPEYLASLLPELELTEL
jgi:hypothetical protein